MTAGGGPIPAGGDPIATPAVPQAGLVNIANVLTVVRLLLVPFFLWLLFTDGTWWRIAALVVFGVASFTARVDGQLARSRNLVTDFGKIADPIADKALTGSALVGLSLLGDLWWWVTVVILIAQVLLGAMNVWAGEHAWLIVAHLAAGTLLWLSLIRFAFTLPSVPEVSATGARRPASVDASGPLSPVARRAG